MRKRKPRGFRTGHDDSLACPHRDVTCCPECAAKYPEIMDVAGRHYWVTDPDERAELEELIRTESAYKSNVIHRYGIWCRVSGGVTGTREAWAKDKNGRMEFASREEAEKLAAHYTKQTMGNPYRTADYRYTVEEL